jgi:hypothetical protein
LNLDSIEGGECQVHNQPDYLSLISKQDSKPITISNFADNFATILGLSSDQVEANFHEKKVFYLIQIID